ncbi:hypothetical protein LSTR_LSTR002966 [Laodelphax striatellus]|uniref:5'-3' exoribonuclease n=1 Tax=Laodelphax striatellus TaxID=195883 RepID=A0A482WTM6_LAOST|nr:hypothetical protein LSTR_LSTR002966 [Laodelphax striatellus]
MMIAIFECIDRLFRIVRPRKILYMAIDGVAPRAKMNQQRSRRFRAAKETTEKVYEIARIRKEMAEKGMTLPPLKEKESHFDSNCITPGTPFMARLSDCLHYYIHERMNSDPGWQKIKVILSDANVPGEGEHKIMDYIRRQRAQPNHDPNTQHCLCGADADLIMLGLATHEPNFTIIREEFKPNKPRPCDICGNIGHEMKDCLGLEKEGSADMPNTMPIASEQEFIFVRLNVLREYLEKELQMPGLPFEYDFERAVDDWVFMCFFVGNDFLPHLPSLEIREGAIDRLVGLYKKAVYKTGGFVTESGLVNLNRVQLIMSDLGEMEDEIFKNRQKTELMFKERNRQRKRREKMAKMNERPAWTPTGQFAPQALGRGGSGGGGVAPIQNARQEAYQMRMQGMQRATEFYQGRGNSNQQGNRYGGNSNQQQGSDDNSPRGQKRKNEDIDDDEEPDPPDEVRLWESGFKDRYYESKFDVSPNNIDFRQKVALQYVRGLSWVLRYYYQGCASWEWYFPYHYAPFASDFVDIARVSIEFEKNTKPFQPLEQLMGVFPAASSSHVPPAWAKLMKNHDSPIIDFYPEDFKIDLNGKKFAWQGVALLPFVDEVRLRHALKDYYPLLTDAERKRNQLGDDRLYIGDQHPSYSFLAGLYKNKTLFSTETELSTEGVRGRILLSEECVTYQGTLPSPVLGLPVVRLNSVTVVKFRDPTYPDSYIFKASRLSGAKEPPRVLKPDDMPVQDRNNWRPQIGMVPSRQQASLGRAGHNMLGHYTPRNQQKLLGSYNSVPAPSTVNPRSNFGGRGSPYGNRPGSRFDNDNRSSGYRSTNPPDNRNSRGRYDNRSTAQNWADFRKEQSGGGGRGGGGGGGGGGGYNSNYSNRNTDYNSNPYSTNYNARSGGGYNSGGSGYRGNSGSGYGGSGSGGNYNQNSNRPAGRQNINNNPNQATNANFQYGGNNWNVASRR